MQTFQDDTLGGVLRRIFLNTYKATYSCQSTGQLAFFESCLTFVACAVVWLVFVDSRWILFRWHVRVVPQELQSSMALPALAGVGASKTTKSTYKQSVVKYIDDMTASSSYSSGNESLTRAFLASDSTLKLCS